mgnify:FL=1
MQINDDDDAHVLWWYWWSNSKNSVHLNGRLLNFLNFFSHSQPAQFIHSSFGLNAGLWWLP